MPWFERFIRRLTVSLKVLAILSIVTFAWFRRSIVTLENSTSYDGKATLQYQKFPLDLGWRVVLSNQAQPGIVTTNTLTWGLNKVSWVYFNWSPDDEMAVVDVDAPQEKDEKEYLFSRTSEKLEDLQGLLRNAGGILKGPLQVDWISWHVLSINGFFFDYKSKTLKKVRNSISLEDGSKDHPLMLWDLECGSAHLVDLSYGDFSRDVFLIDRDKKIKVTTDNRHVSAGWNEKCSAAIVNNYGGSNFSELFLVKRENASYSVVNFSDQLKRQLPEYKWLEDFGHLYYSGAWKNEDTVLVDIRGHTDFSAEESPENKSIEALSFTWAANGEVSVFVPEVISHRKTGK